MKKISRYIFIIGFATISFAFGMSSGHYKHFPFGLIYSIKNSTQFVENLTIYNGRNYNIKGLDLKEINISNDTGIYLTYGQSNSTNDGELGYIVRNEVYQFILGSTFDYKDPSLGVNGDGGSVWGMVGDKLIESEFHNKVIFSNSGYGGKRIADLKEGGYFDFLVLNYITLMKKYGRVDGILFHQGESDNNLDGVKNYYNDFSEFISNLNKNGIVVPVYLSRASLCSKNYPTNESLIKIQNQLISDFDIIREGPNTDLLSSRSHRLEDYCHFSLEGYDKFSDMWVDSLTDFYNK